MKQYYRFPQHLDVDRYNIDGKTQDTVIAVRELNQSGQSANDWFNNTLVYTHGFGVVAAYGNQRSPDGQPLFLESGIPSTGDLGDFEPRIYFGENSPRVLDRRRLGERSSRPSSTTRRATDDDNGNDKYTTFDGDGGPKLDNVFKRLVYAIKFQSEQVVLSSNVTDESQILYDRNPLDARAEGRAVPDPRLRHLPGGRRRPRGLDRRRLHDDRRATRTRASSSSRTRSPTPTRRPPGYALDDINYIRNSVKATVDAYSRQGDHLRLGHRGPDPADLGARSSPARSRRQSEMSDDLIAHIRYPADLFKVQRSILETYHVTDAGTFYSANDAWVTPNDPTQPAASAKAQPPYYLTMQVPGTGRAGVHAVLDLHPAHQSGDASQSVLTGYLAVNSDAGPDYGKLTLLTLPKDGHRARPRPGAEPVHLRRRSWRTSSTSCAQRRHRGDPRQPADPARSAVACSTCSRSTCSRTVRPATRCCARCWSRSVRRSRSKTRWMPPSTRCSAVTAGRMPATATVPTDPTDSGRPAATDPTTPTDPTRHVDEAALATALADYQTALKDRQQAYADGDLVAAARPTSDAGCRGGGDRGHRRLSAGSAASSAG